MRIAICEDDKNHLLHIKRLLDCYSKDLDSDFTISVFQNIHDLLQHTKERIIYDLYLLDIFLPDGNGMTLAQELRKGKITSPIIFLTTSRDYALDAYGVNAIQYLLKPIIEDAFFHALQTVIKMRKIENSKHIILKIDKQFHPVPLQDIMYTESYGHNQIIYLNNNKELKVRMSVNELFSQLSVSPQFVRCGSAYILNLSAIKTLHPKKVSMAWEKEISLPRGSYSQLREQYFQYYDER